MIYSCFSWIFLEQKKSSDGMILCEYFLLQNVDHLLFSTINYLWCVNISLIIICRALYTLSSIFNQTIIKPRQTKCFLSMLMWFPYPLTITHLVFALHLISLSVTFILLFDWQKSGGHAFLFHNSEHFHGLFRCNSDPR